MNFEDIAIGIRKYNKLQNCQNIISAIEKTISLSPDVEWKSAMVSTGKEGYKVNKDVRNTLIWLLKKDEYSKDTQLRIDNLSRLIDNEINECLFHYDSEYSASLRQRDNYELLKYTENNHLDWHTDDGSSNHSRVSILFYLNDDYDGGEIEFKNFNILYKPMKGDILIFPSSYIYRHRVRKVTNGVRYVIANFVS
jgi:Rps23 Pro-64 3,4-dihydroxylase Tpa1-like proline 4-hydroxylase